MKKKMINFLLVLGIWSLMQIPTYAQSHEGDHYLFEYPCQAGGTWKVCLFICNYNCNISAQTSCSGGGNIE